VIITARIAPGTFENIKFRADDYIVCADGGYDEAYAHGISPAVVIGDFDSACATDFGGAETIRLPAEKDDTDTLAAVRHAIGKGYEDFLIIGGLSGRFDHSYAVVQTLSFLTDMGCKAEVIDGYNSAYMISGGKRGIGEIELDHRESSRRVYFSVYSYTERSEGVTIAGAKYPLNFAILTHSYPMGTSNEFIPDERAVITVVAGRLLIVVSEE
jgi:thiamine pyrophosphokinase